MDSLVEDGDEIIAVRVIELDEGGEFASSHDVRAAI
jgi:hypothetical protein